MKSFDKLRFEHSDNYINKTAGRTFVFAMATLILGLGAAPAQEGAIPIEFTLERDGHVTLVIDDAKGVRVRNLVSNVSYPAGTHTVYWDGIDQGDASLVKDPDGVWRTRGSLVSPGTYHVRGLVHDTLGLTYEFTVNTPGNPPWLTHGKGMGVGNWTADHSPPVCVLYVPADRMYSNKETMVIGSFVAEAGHGLILTDLDGKKYQGIRSLLGNWTGAQALALDVGDEPVKGYYAFAAAGWHDIGTKRQAEVRVAGMTEHGPVSMLMHHEPKPKEAANSEAKASVSGLAVRNGLIVVARDDKPLLMFVRVPIDQTGQHGSWNGRVQRKSKPKGTLLGTAEIPGLKNVAFAPDGRLLVLVGTELRSYTLNREQPHKLPQPKVLISKGLENPRGLTVDPEGNILISDRGTSHQVKRFDASGTLLAAIGNPGAPTTGPYDPKRMQNPAGMAIDSCGRIWVAEEEFLPKRVSVWESDGTLVTDYIGPPDYGAGGEIDPKDPKRFYYGDWHAGGIEFALDWRAGTNRPSNIYWRTYGDTRHMKWQEFQDETTGQVASRALFYSGIPQTPIYHDGQQYLSNNFHARPSAPPAIIQIWRMDDGEATPIAAVGNAWSSPVMMQWDALRNRWPETIDREMIDLYAGVTKLKKGETPHRRYMWSNPVLFTWSDQNNNGKVDPEEVELRTVEKGRFDFVWLNLDFSIQTATGIALPAPTFASKGVPVYDLAAARDIITDAIPKGFGELVLGSDGLALRVSSPLTGYKDGKLQWRYPNQWNSIHRGHRAPPQQYPGQLVATTKLIGYPFTAGPDKLQLVPYNGDRGNVYLMTMDGLYVDRLFLEPRGSNVKRWDTLPHQRGMSVAEVAIPGENFWPRMVQLDDGRVYLITGKNHSSIVRLDKLDTLRRLPEQTLTVSAKQLTAAAAHLQAKELERQNHQEQKTLIASIRGETVTVDGGLTDWADASWVKINDQASAAIATHGDQLYMAYKLAYNRPARNKGGEPELLFKTGGALDLMLATNPKADPKRKSPVQGDRRILVTDVDGKTVAMLYEPVSAKDKASPVPFSSPWRSIMFDRVQDISAEVTMKHKKIREKASVDGGRPKDTYFSIYEVSIPLKVLEVSPKPGLTLRGDVGLLLGSEGITTDRTYWMNKATGLLNDIPGEAMLTPRLWGDVRFEN